MGVTPGSEHDEANMRSGRSAKVCDTVTQIENNPAVNLSIETASKLRIF